MIINFGILHLQFTRESIEDFVCNEDLPLFYRLVAVISRFKFI